MATWVFLAAGAVSALWLAVHLILGGREIARPLLRAGDLNHVVRDTLYLCWHFTSVAIAVIAGCFLWAGITGDTQLAVAGIVLAAGFALSGIGIVMGRGGNHMELPQGWLFVPVAGLGLWGLLL